jgi:hypothetical protein
MSESSILCVKFCERSMEGHGLLTDSSSLSFSSSAFRLAGFVGGVSETVRMGLNGGIILYWGKQDALEGIKLIALAKLSRQA